MLDMLGELIEMLKGVKEWKNGMKAQEEKNVLRRNFLWLFAN